MAHGCWTTQGDRIALPRHGDEALSLRVLHCSVIMNGAGLLRLKWVACNVALRRQY